MTTNVQNAGRQRAYDRAKCLGVDLVLEWTAILDGATRHSHRQMHGERKVNDRTVKFSNGCRWPGDPQGPAAEVYNCRCTTLSWVEGFEGDTVTSSPVMGNVSFEEWQKQREKKARGSFFTAGKPYQKNVVDTTGRWFPNAIPGSHQVVDADQFKATNGTLYRIHGTDVILNYDAHEKEIAELLAREIGGEVLMVPKVNKPYGVRTPDYILNGRQYDLKTLEPDKKARGIFQAGQIRPRASALYHCRRFKSIHDTGADRRPNCKSFFFEGYALRCRTNDNQGRKDNRGACEKMTRGRPPLYLPREIKTPATTGLLLKR